MTKADLSIALLVNTTQRKEDGEVKLLIRGEDKEYFESLLDKLKDY